jgi:DNA-binding PadR family transcriptional regulator
LTQPKADLLQGTLDMLILKALSLGPLHGYGIIQRLRQLSDELLEVEQGSLYRQSIGLSNVAGSVPSGV